MSIPTEKDVLFPSKEALLHVEMSSPGSEQLLQEADVVDARKCMNAMRTVGAALNKVVLEEHKSGEAFQSLLDEAARVSRMLLLRWGHNPDDRRSRWMLNVVEKSLMPYLSPFKKLDEETVNSLAENLRDRAVEHNENDDWKQSEIIDVTIFAGTAKLLFAQSEFNFGRKGTLEEDLSVVVEQVTSTARNALAELCPDLTPHGDRVTFYTVVLEQLFDIMEASWRRNASKGQAALAGFSQQQLKQWQQANPQGFELTPVIETFEKNAGRLLRLTVAARKNDKKGKK